MKNHPIHPTVKFPYFRTNFIEKHYLRKAKEQYWNSHSHLYLCVLLDRFPNWPCLPGPRSLVKKIQKSLHPISPSKYSVLEYKTGEFDPSPYYQDYIKGKFVRSANFSGRECMAARRVMWIDFLLYGETK